MKEKLTQSVQNALVSSGYGDPFAVLGIHENDDGAPFIRVMYPHTHRVDIISTDGQVLGTMEKIRDEGLYQLSFPDRRGKFAYRLRVYLNDKDYFEVEDAYRFSPVLSPFDLYLFGEGNHKRLYEKLGAHFLTHDGVDGVNFAVWAPNARRVSVVGNFNDWDGRRHALRNRDGGVWEIFIPGLQPGDLYKFEIIGPKGQMIYSKTDPYGFQAEMRPKTASVLCRTDTYKWEDDDWISKRKKHDAMHTPVTIYEMHLGSWRRNPIEGNRWLTYRELAHELPEYLKYMGFTHVEFLPVTEHPFDGSWGYQPIGMYAPTSRFGTPDDFKYLVDKLHQAGLGVILDWVPAHFPKDDHGLSFFDGTALYEHDDPRKGEHKEWGTKIYNYSRNEVSNFLAANALFWLNEYHIDGLRVDAVASMLYLDYNREKGQWVPNEYGGNENIEAVNFVRKFNEWVYAENMGYITIAEESTAWGMVSRPTYLGGLGFTYKWNMGWMNDTLHYMHRESIHRKFHQNEITFAFVYAFSENFILPLSHDEVVSGKGPLIDKMTGDRWQKFASLRAYFGFMYASPGKKLLFMGDEFAQDREWNYADSCPWHLIGNDDHRGVQRLVKDLNELASTEPALYEFDFEEHGFEWVDGSDVDRSVITFIRKGKNPDDILIIASNFTPVPWYGYKIGTPYEGTYDEILNTDNLKYSGSDLRNFEPIQTSTDGWNFKPFSVSVNLPPLATIILKLTRK